MENYYFIVIKGEKQGPYKLIDLKKQVIYFDDLIWRSDSDQWIKAKYFEEIEDIIIFKPPPTPREQLNVENRRISYHVLKTIAFYYGLSCLLLTLFSWGFTNSSWEKYLKAKQQIQYPVFGSYDSRYSTYLPGADNESRNANGQSFLFRSFRALFSTVYLTSEEQNNNAILFFDLMLSSIVSLSFIFLIIGFIYYYIQKK